jgi:hypothetical protein
MRTCFKMGERELDSAIAAWTKRRAFEMWEGEF